MGLMLAGPSVLLLLARGHLVAGCWDQVPVLRGGCLGGRGLNFFSGLSGSFGLLPPTY